MAEGNGRNWSSEIKEIGDKIVALTVGKAVELGDYLEQVHGIKPAAGGVAVMAGPAAGPAAAEKPPEKTEFTVQLDGLADPAKKITVIKVVREITSLGLVLGDVFLHRLGRAFNQVLGFLQTQAGDLADHLDDVDLFAGIGQPVELDRELSLHLGHGGRACGGGGRHGDSAGGGLDAVDLFEVVAQLDRLADGQSHNLVAQVFDIARPGAAISFCHGDPVLS